MVNCVKSLYKGGREWLKVGMEADEYFVVKCSLRWECVLSPWMF